MAAMAAPQIQRDRAQNLWASYERKFPPVSKATALDPNPNLGFEEIGGLVSAKDEILTYACAVTDPEVYARWGTFPPSAILLLGRAGVGKSLLARALATRTKNAFLHVRVPDLVTEIVHFGGKLGELLEGWKRTLEEMPHVTVFLEELEFSRAHALGTLRADLPIGPIMDFLLDLLDRTIAAEGTLVVGSTSHPDTLRPAFVAPGRFERVVEVTPVYPDDIVAALKIHAASAVARAGRPLFEEIDWNTVVKGSSEISPGEWVRLLHAVLRRKARCEAAHEEVKPVSTQDLSKEAERARRAQNQLKAGAGNYL